MLKIIRREISMTNPGVLNDYKTFGKPFYKYEKNIMFR